jgi:hypothetical protein
MSTTLRLGNPNPQMQVEELDENGALTGRKTSVDAEHLNQSTTEVQMRDDFADEEFVERTLSTDNDRVLAMIAGLLPTDLRRWAVAVNEAEQIWGARAHRRRRRGSRATSDGARGGARRALRLPARRAAALLTNAGRDALHAQHLGTSGAARRLQLRRPDGERDGAGGGDTTLTGEIATAGGGLVRAQATYAHTAGTNTSTLTKTFTANASDALPVTVAKIGVFNAARPARWATRRS